MRWFDIETLKFNVRYKLYKLGSDSLTSKDYEKLQDYIETLSEDELKTFDKLFERFYHYRKYNGQKRYKITSAAIKLTVKIAKQTPFKVFPYIERIARKSWDCSGGTYAFGMTCIDSSLPYERMLYSSEPAVNFLKKSKYIDYDTNYIGDIEISAESIKDKRGKEQ